MSDTRRKDRNVGMLVDRDMPDDRRIIAGYIVMRDDAGDISVYSSQQEPERAPHPEVQIEIAAMVAQAHQISSL